MTERQVHREVRKNGEVRSKERRAEVERRARSTYSLIEAPSAMRVDKGIAMLALVIKAGQAHVVLLRLRSRKRPSMRKRSLCDESNGTHLSTAPFRAQLLSLLVVFKGLVLRNRVRERPLSAEDTIRGGGAIARQGKGETHSRLPPVLLAQVSDGRVAS